MFSNITVLVIFTFLDPQRTSTPLIVDSNLVGTSSERKLLSEEIQSAFENSLASDKKKDQVKLDQEIEEGRLLAVMESRKSRVEPEPDLSEPHVTISIRHCSIGNKVRLFKAESLFHSVYDWVGSLLMQPEHFEIKDYKGCLLVPDSQVYSGSFNMVEANCPILLTPNGTVAFKGFGVANDMETSAILDVTNDSDQSIIFLEDVISQISSESNYSTLQHLRESAKDKLNQNVLFVEVSREEIFDDMMSLYRKRNTTTHVINIAFKGEDAGGDGVSRDAYSAYFESVYRKMEGHTEKVPSPLFEEEELAILGTIITHAFVSHNIFPISLCKASIKKVLIGDIADTELLASFMNFIAPREVDIVHQYRNGNIKHAQAIVDILSEYSIFTQLTPDNVMSLMEKAAKVALVHKPYFAMKTLLDGMGCFWNKVCSKMFESIYLCAIPNAEIVIENIIANEVCPQDQNITTWTHRYIRSCSSEELLRFLRFVTGSTNFPPNTTIKIEFVDQPQTHLRPYAKTCFKILIMPRQYASFTQLSENLNFHISHPSNWAVYDSI